MKDLISVIDAAQRLGMVPNTLRRHALKNLIAHTLVGKRVFFTPEQFADIIKIHTPGVPTSDVTIN